MSPENFCYWLMGYLELSGSKNLTNTQVEDIKNHLKLVFNKVTPEVSKETTGTITLTEEEVRFIPVLTQKPALDGLSDLNMETVLEKMKKEDLLLMKKRGEDLLKKFKNIENDKTIYCSAHRRAC